MERRYTNEKLLSCRYHHVLKPRQLLCLFLVYEKHRGNKSDWYFYIKTLPESYTNVVNWSKEDISWLPGDLQDEGILLHEEIERSYAGIDGYTHTMLLHVLFFSIVFFFFFLEIRI